MYLLLKAVEYNWGLMSSGGWNHIEWKIKSNGLYTVSIHFNSETGDWDSKSTVIREIGKMSQAKFKRFVLAAEQKWHTGIEVYGYDGVAWAMQMYDSSGNVIKKWEKGYIDGQPALEEISKVLLSLLKRKPA